MIDPSRIRRRSVQNARHAPPATAVAEEVPSIPKRTSVIIKNMTPRTTGMVHNYYRPPRGGIQYGVVLRGGVRKYFTREELIIEERGQGNGQIGHAS